MLNPTYRNLGDHTECFQVDFDPETVSYEDLLQLVWEIHDPTRPAHKTQYESLILAHDDHQLSAARESMARLQFATGRRIVTRIERLDRFWMAENYHQKYYLRNDPVLMRRFVERCESEDDFVNSTEAARANGSIYLSR